MKKSDYIGIAFPVLFALLVIFFPFNTAVTTGLFDGGELLKTQTVWTGFTTKGLDQFGNVTKYHPYIMGFLKFALLAMFGASTAANSFAMAQQMGGDAALAGNIVVWTGALCTFTLFGWSLLFKTLGMF